MKIVGFVGSPRKRGNTELLVREILAGADEKGAETKCFHLNAVDMKGCQGCMKCKEGDKCGVRDGMSPLYDEILSASGIVVGSPIYMLQISGQTKLFLDRLYALVDINDKPRIRPGLPVVLVYTQLESNPEAFKTYFDSMHFIFEGLGFYVADTLIAAGTWERGDVVKQEELMKKAGKIGRKIALP